MNRLVPSLPRPWRVLLGVAVAAGLNGLRFDLVGGAEARLGVMVIMPLVLLLPGPWAVLAAILASAPSIWLAGGPFVLVLAGLEAAWLVTIGRRWRSAALADLVFWICLGVPLGLGMYALIARVPLDDGAFIMVNHLLNAQAAVLVAEVIVRSTGFAAWVASARPSPYALRELIFNTVFSIAVMPLLLMGFGVSLLLQNAAVTRERTHLNQAVVQIGRQLDVHLRLHESAVAAAARVMERGGSASVVLEETRRAYPEFTTMLVADREGRLVTTSPEIPALRGSSVADRNYFGQARDSHAPYVSGVFRGRGFGSDTLIAIAVPVFSPDGAFAGIVEGSIEVNRFATSIGRQGLPPEVSIAVIDSAHRVVMADAPTGLHPLEQLSQTSLAPVLRRENSSDIVSGEVAAPDGSLDSVRMQWMPADFGFSVLAARPAMIGLDQLIAIYLMLGGIIAAVLGAAAWLARVASHRLAGPLELFARDAVDQAESGSVAEMVPPSGPTPREVAMVFAAFNCLAARMRESHAALVRTNAELDARVAERTKELRAAQEAAEAASRSKTDFVAMTGHEIRTPLNAIIGLANSIHDALPPGSVANHAQTIHRAGLRLLRVVNDLLDLSRVEAGRLELDLQPAEVGATAAEVLDLLSQQARQQELSLELESDLAGAVWLQMDAPRLQQVLINLIGNALKFTREGGVRLKISTVAATEASMRLTFSVIDTGPGIRPDEQPRLFQPYVQLEGPSEQRAVGTGLGLAISRRLVELFGGTVAVRSTVGEGTEFYFTAEFRRAAVPLARPSAAPGHDLADLNVLVADDDLANQEVLRAFLEGRCRRFETVATARDALERLEREPFDVALIDLEMPDEGGEVVAKAMRLAGSVKGAGECALIAVSAHSPDEKRPECLAVGFDEYLPKPVDRQELYRLLHAVKSARRHDVTVSCSAA